MHEPPLVMLAIAPLADWARTLADAEVWGSAQRLKVGSDQSARMLDGYSAAFEHSFQRVPGIGLW